MSAKSFGLRYYLKAFDKDGKVIKEVEETESRSWVSNFIAILKGMLAPSEVTLVDEDGNTVTIVSADGRSDFNGSIVEDGASSASGSPLTWKLLSKLGEAPATVTAMTIVGNRVEINIYGTIVHPSPVTVNEIGFAAKMVDSGGVERKILFARDVLPAPISIPAGGGLYIRYTPYTLY